MKNGSLDKLIRIDPDICHGQPCFAGTRIMVWQVLELLEAGIRSSDVTSRKYFPQLTAEHIRAALHFAAEQLKHREFVGFAKS